MPQLILVRHGETEANRLRIFGESEDIPLTDTGREQARELAQRLAREFTPHLMVTSPFLRARQTSEIIGSVLGLAAETLPGIHERDFGCLKGHPYEKFTELFPPDTPEPWLWRPPGGESLEDVRLRVVESLTSLRQRYPEEDILVVCHGAVIQTVSAHVAGSWSEASIPPNCGVVTVTASFRS